MACCRESPSRVTKSMSFSLLPDPLSPTEDALRTDQQHQDQHDQCTHVLELRRDEQRRDLDEDADHEGADAGAVDRAEATEGDRCEDQEQGLEAELVVE